MTASAALRVRWSFASGNVRAMRSTRRAIAAFLVREAEPGSDLAGCELVLGELMANAVRHAPPGRVDIELEWQAGGAYLRVSDRGAGFVPRGSLPDAAAESGRGLYIVAQLAGDATVRQADGVCTVSVFYRIRRAGRR